MALENHKGHLKPKRNKFNDNKKKTNESVCKYLLGAALVICYVALNLLGVDKKYITQ